MSILESLSIGRFGVSLRPPSNLRVVTDDAGRTVLANDEKDETWYLFFFPDLAIDLREEHEAHLRRSLEWNARFIFDQVYHRSSHFVPKPPRTADATWSAMVDVEYLMAGGAPALRTTHRMAYEPAHELIMGHILIPLRRGLFEARVLCEDRVTGLRESTLYELWERGEFPSDVPHAEPGGFETIIRTGVGLPQSALDDPLHDERFPTHALSRTRSALRSMCADWDLRASDAALPGDESECEILELGCAITPPPRYVYRPPVGETTDAMLCRVSFCGTDGVERLLIARWGAPSGQAPRGVVEHAEAFASELAAVGDADDVQSIERLPPLDGRDQVLLVQEGTRDSTSVRVVARLFLDDRERCWIFRYAGSAAVPRDVIAAELDATVRSFRLLEAKRRASWWRR